MDGIIRGEIGFDGLVMTDDLDMKALSGSLAERARASLAAGCDVVLQCSGDLRDMRGMATEIPALEGRALERAEAARAPVAEGPLGMDEAQARLDELMAPLERAA